VCDTFGVYGSPYGADSIHNQFGNYGSEYSVLSAYSQFTVTPPQLVCVSTGLVLNYVSKNSALPNAIDPDSLCNALAASGH
jgi:hypothetical protein